MWMDGETDVMQLVVFLHNFAKAPDKTNESLHLSLIRHVIEKWR